MSFFLVPSLEIQGGFLNGRWRPIMRLDHEGTSVELCQCTDATSTAGMFQCNGDVLLGRTNSSLQCRSGLGREESWRVEAETTGIVQQICVW